MQNSSDKMATKDIVAIIAAALMAFLGVLIETSMNVTFPTLTKEFNVPLATIQWVTTGYLLMVSIVIVCSAYIEGRFKERNIFISGVLFSIVGDLICALAPQFTILLLGRLIQAIGTGIVLPLLFNIILERAPMAKRGIFMGIGGLVVSLAPALGPTFGGIVVFFLSWRDIFWITLPLMILGLLLSFSIDQKTPLRKEKFDWLRLFFLAIVFISITLAFNSVSALGWLNWQLALGLVIAAISLWIFIVISKRSSRVLISINIFKNRIFDFALLAYIFIQVANIGINFVLPNYAQIADHATSLTAGLILLPGSLISGLLNPVWGRMYDTLGAKKPIVTGNTIFFVAIVLFAAVSMNMSPMMILGAYLLFAIGMTMSFANTMTYALTAVGQESEADANAWFNTLQQFGGSIGTAIASSFLASGSGNSAAAVMKSGTQHVFIFMGVLIFINFISYHFTFKSNK